MGLVNILIGISGTAGAIELGTGLVRSMTLIILGLLLCLTDKLIRYLRQNIDMKGWKYGRW